MKRSTEKVSQPSSGMSASSDWANPAVIGLMGFGMTTMVTGLSNVSGLNINGSPVLALALIWGGTAQFLAGFVALRKGNIFAGSAFTGYGSFWIALYIMLFIVGGVSGNDLLVFWFVWTLFTFTFLINAWKHGIGIFAVFLLLFIAYLLLDAVAAGATSIQSAAGYEIFLDGLIAWYVATAILVEAHYGRKILPH
ncbi:MAG: acetate uptake transporter [Thaumarchaeota archaeon]|nr:acetate uptake transporter [Nitrososphaerota archaeon]